MAKKEEVKTTALYEQLPRDDEQVEEPNSVQDQKTHLEEYAHQHGVGNIRHSSDDGYNGMNFNRPGFSALLEEIEVGHATILIVEDLSRFDRNHLQVGCHTEIAPPKRGIRFVAINSSVDSANPSDNDLTPFLNIMNEWYAKDTNNRIKTVPKVRTKNGMRCSGSIPYEYKRTKNDRQQMLTDESAVEAIRKIFRLTCQGVGVTPIAEMSPVEKILIPPVHAARHFPGNCRHSGVADPYRWNVTIIGYILDRQEYLGYTVLGKSTCKNFKTKQRGTAVADELMIFPDAYEATIEQDIWNVVHKLRLQKRPKAANGTYTYRLSGSTRCADCGVGMNFCSPDRVENGK